MSPGLPPVPGADPSRSGPSASPLLPPSLVHRRSDLVEWMDLEDCDPQRLRNTFRRFPLVNRWIARWPAVYRRCIRPLLHREHVTRLLDVGCGGGDIPRSMAAWARRDGLRLEVTAIDPDPRALAFAREAMGRAEAPVAFRQGTARELAARGERFHLVTSNHVLHHLSPPELQDFLADLEALATRRIVLADIERSRMGYLLFSLLTPLLARNSFLRTDGLLSIRRSYTAPELRQALPSGWRVERHRPFRLLAVRERPAP